MAVDISEIAELFALAEEQISVIEALGLGLDAPAVNQLRYVAFHLLRAEKAENEKDKEFELTEAKHHCQRARYDAAGVGITHYLEQIDIFQNDYKSTVINNTVDDYLDICALAEEASEFLKNRVRESINDRGNADNSHFEKAVDYFTKLKDVNRRLTLARPELNKVFKIGRNMMLGMVISIFIGAGGIIVALLALFK